MKTFAVTALLATASIATADEEVDATEEVDETFTVPSTDGAAFVETFQSDPFGEGRWVESTGAAYEGQEWSWETAKAASGKYIEDKVRVFFLRSMHLLLFMCFFSMYAIPLRQTLCIIPIRESSEHQSSRRFSSKQKLSFVCGR